jgi:hypothetical protein
MKSDKTKKAAGNEPATKMKREDFLKTLGIGIGASLLGRSALAGAAASPAAQQQLQCFIRTLIENPDLAAKFMKDPAKIAKDNNIKLSDADLRKIKDSIKKIRLQSSPGAEVGRDYMVRVTPDHVVGARPGTEKINPPDIKQKTR